MRITAIAAHTVRWPIAATGAARGRSERAAVLVEVRSDRGIVGLGEAAPLLGLSRDHLDDAEAAIAGFARCAPFEVVARPYGATVDTRGALLAFETRPVAFDAGFDAPFEILHDRAAGLAPMVPPAPRFAIQTALCDALAREAGVSFATWLAARVAPGDTGLSPAAARAASTGTSGPGPAGDRTALPIAAVVDDIDGALRAYAAGIRCLKIKLAADDPASRVHAIAAAVPGVRLRIDANRSWPRAEVAARLEALAALPIDYVEEPCRDAHQLLATPLPYRIALDESLAELSADQLTAALASRQLAAVILKPTLLGSLSACLAIAVRARRAGVAAIVSHGLEGPIGTAACAELALALDGMAAALDRDSIAPGGTRRARAAVGLAPHPGLAGWAIGVAQLAGDHVQPGGGAWRRILASPAGRSASPSSPATTCNPAARPASASSGWTSPAPCARAPDSTRLWPTLRDKDRFAA
jgi:L-alanine-DL-glutamate epimerase-like enolase superfamily enzyme